MEITRIGNNKTINQNTSRIHLQIKAGNQYFEITEEFSQLAIRTHGRIKINPAYSNVILITDEGE